MQKIFKNKRKILFSLLVIAVAVRFYIRRCFFISLVFMVLSLSLLRCNISKNGNVEWTQPLDYKAQLPFYEHDIKIQTKDEYKIFLYNVNLTSKNKNIQICRINDIRCVSGTVYEITDNDQSSWNLTNPAILGKLIGKKLNSVGDIVDNREELYELFKLLESKPQAEFSYEDRFIIKANFIKGGSQNFY